MDTPSPEKKHRLSLAEFEALRALHKAVHAELKRYWADSRQGPLMDDRAAGQHHRTALLAWAFVRGLPYRRIEPLRHLQVLSMSPGAVVSVRDEEVQMHGIQLYEHHAPDAKALHAFLAKHVPTLTAERVERWLAEEHQASASKVSALVSAFAERAAAKKKATAALAVAPDAQLALPLAS